MIEIGKIKQVCGACPTLWEGKTLKGESVYIRYRHGDLRVDIDDNTIYSLSNPKHCASDGVMTFKELMLSTYGTLLFTEPEEY